ncbi:hypothetical protein [Arthrobacter sp. 08Y14]|nr:hypothetical protein [Arthrobacter sp. 08Y14]
MRPVLLPTWSSCTPHTDFDLSWLASVPAVLGAAYSLRAGPNIIAL